MRACASRASQSIQVVGKFAHRNIVFAGLAIRLLIGFVRGASHRVERIFERFVHRIQQARGAQFVDAGQITARTKPEMVEEFGRRGVNDRAARNFAAARSLSLIHI